LFPAWYIHEQHGSYLDDGYGVDPRIVKDIQGDIGASRDPTDLNSRKT